MKIRLTSKRMVQPASRLFKLFVDYYTGTGTQAGDPIEASAIASVFSPGRDVPIRVGSIKTNVGHLEAASGVTALIKVVLMLENKKILPNLNFEKPNPNIPLEEWKIRVSNLKSSE